MSQSLHDPLPIRFVPENRVGRLSAFSSSSTPSISAVIYTMGGGILSRKIFRNFKDFSVAIGPVVSLVVLGAWTNGQWPAVMVGVQSIGETAFDGVVVNRRLGGVIDLNPGNSGCAAGGDIVVSEIR